MNKKESIAIVGAGIVGAKQTCILSEFWRLRMSPFMMRGTGQATSAAAELFCPGCHNAAIKKNWYSIAAAGAGFLPNVCSIDLNEDAADSDIYRQSGHWFLKNLLNY